MATVVAFGLFWFGRSAWGGHFLADHSPGKDVYHLGTLYARWAHHVGNGHFPAWFPEFAGGFPVGSAWMYGLFYPGQLLFVVLPVQAAWTWSAILHMAFGGLGVYLLVRDETRSPLGALTAGLAFALSEFMVGRVLCGHLNLVAPMAWAPWTFLAVTRIVAGSRPAVAWGALCLALGVLAGHVQVWFYMAPALVLFAGHRWYRARADADADADAAGAGRRLLLGGALAVLLTAVQWLPALELTSLAGSAVADRTGIDAFCAPAHQLASKVFPGVFGHRPGAYWAPDTAEHEFTAIGGLLLIVLLLPALTRRAQGARVWAALAALGLLLAPGVHNPLSELLNTVPPFSFGRTPARALGLVVLGVSVLVGHGVARWTSEEVAPRIPVAAGIAGVLGVAALALVFARLPGGTPRADVVATAVVAGVGTAGAALVVLALRRRHPRAVAVLPVLVVVAASLGGVPPASTVDARFFHTDWMAHLPPDLAEHRVHLLGHGFPNVERQGVRTLRELCYLDAPWYRRFREDAVPERAAWLDVGAQLSGIANDRLFAPDLGAEDVLVRTYETHGAARLFASAQMEVSDAAALAALDRGALTLHLADAASWPRSSPTAPRGMVDSVRVVPGDDPGTLEYDVTSLNRGWLFVSEKHFPGWEADVNGVSRPIHRANVMFRAVQVPPGGGRVTMNYRPAPLRRGAWISLAALLLTLALFVWSRRGQPAPS